MKNAVRRICDIVFDPRIVVYILAVHCVLLCTFLGHHGWMYAVPYFLGGYVLCLTAYQILVRRVSVKRAEIISLTGLLIAELICLILRGADVVSIGALFCDLILIAAVFLCGGSIREGRERYFSFFLLLVILFDLACALSMIPGFPILNQYSLGIVDGDLTTLSINANQLAMLNMCGLFFCALFGISAVCKRQFGRMAVLAGCSIVFIVLILLTNSRTCEAIAAVYLVCFAVAIPFVLTKNENRHKMLQRVLRCAVIVLLCVVLLVVAYRYFLPDAFLNESLIPDEVASQDTLGGKIDTLLAGRLRITDTALDLWREQPILGVGQGNLREPINAVFGYDRDYPSEYLHNGYLQVLCADGVIVFIFFIASMGIILYKVVKRLRRALRDPSDKERGWVFLSTLFLFCLLLYNLVEGNFLTELKHVGLLFWLLSGMLISPEKRTAKE